MLDREHADSPFGPDNWHTRKTVKAFFPRFWDVTEIRMCCRLIQVQRFDIFSDCPNETFAQPQTRDVHSSLVQSAGGKQLKCAIAQEVNRTHFARKRFTDNVDHMVQLTLGMVLRGHHLVQTSQDISGRTGGAFHRPHLAETEEASDTPYQIIRSQPVKAVSCSITSLRCSFCFLRLRMILLSGRGLFSSRSSFCSSSACLIRSADRWLLCTSFSFSLRLGSLNKGVNHEYRQVSCR